MRPDFLRFVAPLLVLLIVAVGLFGYCRRRPLAATALIWALLTLSPALLLWKLQPNDFAHDRYLYIPSIGLSVLIATALSRLPSGRLEAFGRPAVPTLSITVLVLLLSAGTVIQSAHWRDDVALFANAVAHAPAATGARANYAIQLMAHGRYAEARAQFERILAGAPDNWSAIYGIAQLHFLHGRWEDALVYLNRAIALRPYRSEQYIHLGYARLRSGDINGAEAAFREAIRRQPMGLGYHYALGIVLIKQGRRREARVAFERELALDPGQRDTLHQIARLQTELEVRNENRTTE